MRQTILNQIAAAERRLNESNKEESDRWADRLDRLYEWLERIDNLEENAQ